MAYLFEHTKRYLQNVNKLPSLATMTYKEAREMRAKLPKKEVKLADLAKIEDRFIPMRDGGKIAVRVYTPHGDGPFNMMVYYHGGGWVLNDLDTCHESCSYLAFKTGRIIVSVQYRLAPEYPFPIPVHDAFDSYLWTIEYASTLNGNPHDIAVGGDSAGGNLAIAVCQLAAESENELPITAQILLYPVTDLSFNANSYTLFEKGFGLDKDVMEWFGRHYISSLNDAQNPLVAPLRSKDFSKFPRTLIIAAENDVLRDEALMFGEKLSEAGTETKTIVMEGIVHSYFTQNHVFHKEIDCTIQYIEAFMDS
ncbi:alpha/beta hydrolase fold domain-containing protein [Solibacillus silvestris]|uniref:alpha/beta hydrolase n=1 Tax=Solibacillus silvestris TaxID=76853 RepID=UPI003F7F8449